MCQVERNTLQRGPLASSDFKVELGKLSLLVSGKKSVKALEEKHCVVGMKVCDL